MKKLPSIKKRISSFLTNEEGRISKKAVITLSLLASGTAVIIASSPVMAARSFGACFLNAGQIPVDPNCVAHPNSIYHNSHSSY